MLMVAGIRVCDGAAAVASSAGVLVVMMEGEVKVANPTTTTTTTTTTTRRGTICVRTLNMFSPRSYLLLKLHVLQDCSMLPLQ